MGSEISKRLRFETFKRDEFKCQYCGRTPPRVVLEVDHIVPLARGGDSSPENLITSCQDCNRGKGARPLDQVPAPLKDQMQDKQERQEQVEAFNQFLLDARNRELQAIEELGLYWHNKFEMKKDKWVFGPTREASLRTFLKFLAPVEILGAIDLAHDRFPVYSREEDNKTFRYFCGICWRKIKGE